MSHWGFRHLQYTVAAVDVQRVRKNRDKRLCSDTKKKIVYTVCLILWTLSGPRRGLRSVGENMPRYSPKKTRVGGRKLHCSWSAASATSV